MSGRMRFRRTVWTLVALSLVVTGCNRGDEPSPATVPPTTSMPATATDGGGAEDAAPIPELPDDTPGGGDDAVGTEDSTTSKTAATVSGLPTYEVVHRIIEDDHETLVIVVEPGAYSGVALENLVYDVVERFIPNTAIVVDDRAAAELAVLAERTEDEQKQLETHTVLRIENGVEVTFYGPYADIPGITVGS